MRKDILVTLLLVFVPFTSFAQEQIPSDFDAVRISPIEPDLDPTRLSSPDELSVIYDPSQLKDAPKIEMTFSDLQKISAEMASPEFQARIQNEIYIPIAAANNENLAVAENLDPSDLNTFLSKKNKFLEGVVKTLSFIKLRPKAINKVVFMMNEHFYKNAGAFVAANSSVHGARVATLQFGIAGGFGFSDWIMTQLKRSPYLADLPDRSGFYLMLSGGVSLVRRIGPDGRTKISLEPILELRRSTKIFSPFLFGAIGFQGGYTWENRHIQESIQTATFYKVSMVNVISGGQSFGFNAAAAAVFPPGGGALAGIEGKVYRLRLTPAIFSNFWTTIKGFAGKEFGKSCTRVFN